MARWLPSLDRKASGPLEQKDAATRRASAGRGFVYAQQPYVPPGADIDRLVRDGYEKVIWAFKAIDAIADKMSDWPIKVMDGQQPDWKQVDDDPILPLLNQYANNIERASKYFRYRLISQLILSKRGVFVEVIVNRAGTPVALNLLPPGMTAPIPDPDEFLAGFRVTLPGEEQTIDLPVYEPGGKGGVVWIRKPHPTDPYSGITPLEAAGISLDLDFYARLYNRNFLVNDGRAGQLVAVKGGLSPEDAQELKARFSPGMGGAGRTTVIEADSISVQDTAISPRDAQYAELRGITKEDLLIALGTPESVIGNASGRTFDNADAEKENWLDVTVLPLSGVVESGFDVLTLGGYDDERSVVHDVSGEPVLRRRHAQKVAEARADHAAGLITIDEFRGIAELDSIARPGSRVLWVPAGKIAIGAEEDEQKAAQLAPAGSGGGLGAPTAPDADLSGFDASLDALAPAGDPAGVGTDQADPTITTEQDVTDPAGLGVTTYASWGPVEQKALADRLDLEVKKFSAKQPRYPQGHPQGGQFMDSGDTALWLAGAPLKGGWSSNTVIDPNSGSTAASPGGSARFSQHPDPGVRAAAAVLTYPANYPYARVLGAPPAVTLAAPKPIKVSALRRGDVIERGGQLLSVAETRKGSGVTFDLELVEADGTVVKVNAAGATVASTRARTPHPTVVGQAKRDVAAAAQQLATTGTTAPAAGPAQRVAAPTPHATAAAPAPVNATPQPAQPAAVIPTQPTAPTPAPATATPNRAAAILAQPISTLAVGGPGWSTFGSQGGSNPASPMHGPGGTDYYVKSQDAHIADNEVTAARLYAAAGVSVPTIHKATIARGSFGAQNRPQGIASEMVQGTPDMSARMQSDPAYRDLVLEDFAVHAWLGNWDAVENNNTMTGTDGKPLTIDVGGALAYRARGTAKNLPPTVGELQSMRTRGTGGGTAVATFRQLTPDHTDARFVRGVERIVAISPQQVSDLIHQGMPSVPKSERDTLVANIQARRVYLAGVAKVDLPESKPAAVAAAAPAAPPATAAATAPTVSAPAAPAAPAARTFNLPPAPAGALIFAHPSGKHIYLTPDPTDPSGYRQDVYAPSGKRASSSATPFKLLAGHGQWKRQSQPATGPVPVSARAAAAAQAPAPVQQPAPAPALGNALGAAIAAAQTPAASSPAVATLPIGGMRPGATGPFPNAPVVQGRYVGRGGELTVHGDGSSIWIDNNGNATLKDPAQTLSLLGGVTGSTLVYSSNQPGAVGPTAVLPRSRAGVAGAPAAAAAPTPATPAAAPAAPAAALPRPRTIAETTSAYALAAAPVQVPVVQNDREYADAGGALIKVDPQGVITFFDSNGSAGVPMSRPLADRYLRSRSMRDVSGLYPTPAAPATPISGLSPKQTALLGGRSPSSILTPDPATYPYPIVAGAPVATALAAPKQMKVSALRKGDVVEVTGPSGQTRLVTVAASPNAQGVSVTDATGASAVLPMPASGQATVIARTPHPTVVGAARAALALQANPPAAATPTPTPAAPAAPAVPAAPAAPALPLAPNMGGQAADGRMASWLGYANAPISQMPDSPVAVGVPASQQYTALGTANAVITGTPGDTLISRGGSVLVIAQDGSGIHFGNQGARPSVLDPQQVVSHMGGMGYRLHYSTTSGAAVPSNPLARATAPAAPTSLAGTPATGSIASFSAYTSSSPGLPDRPAGLATSLDARNRYQQVGPTQDVNTAASSSPGDVLVNSVGGTLTIAQDGTGLYHQHNGGSPEVLTASDIASRLSTANGTGFPFRRHAAFTGSGASTTFPAAPAARPIAFSPSQLNMNAPIPAGTMGPFADPKPGIYADRDNTVVVRADGTATIYTSRTPNGRDLNDLTVLTGASVGADFQYQASYVPQSGGINQLGYGANPLPVPGAPAPAAAPIVTPAAPTPPAAPAAAASPLLKGQPPSFYLTPPANYPYPIVPGAPVASTLPRPKDLKFTALRRGDVIDYGGKRVTVVSQSQGNVVVQDDTGSQYAVPQPPSGTVSTVARTPHPTVVGAARAALRGNAGTAAAPLGTPAAAPAAQPATPPSVLPTAPIQPATVNSGAGNGPPPLRAQPLPGVPPFQQRVGQSSTAFTSGDLQIGQVFRNSRTGDTITITSQGGDVTPGPTSKRKAGTNSSAQIARSLNGAGWTAESGPDVDTPGRVYARTLRSVPLPPPGTPIAGTLLGGSGSFPAAATGPVVPRAASQLDRGMTVRVGGTDYVVTEHINKGSGKYEVWGYRPGVDDPLVLTQDAASKKWRQGVLIPGLDDVGGQKQIDTIGAGGGAPALNVPSAGVARDYDPNGSPVDTTPVVGSGVPGSPQFAVTHQTVKASTLKPGDVILINNRENEGSFVVTAVGADSRGRPNVQGYSGTQADLGLVQPVGQHLFLVSPGAGEREVRVQVNGAPTALPDLPRPRPPQNSGGINRNAIDDPTTAQAVRDLYLGTGSRVGYPPDASSKGEKKMANLCHLRGYNDVPDVISEDEADDYVRAGEIEVFRGTSDNKAGQDFAEEYRTGSHYVGGIGQNIYGLGSYCAYGTSKTNAGGRQYGANDAIDFVQNGYARGYGYGGGHGVVQRMVLKADARIGEHEALLNYGRRNPDRDPVIDAIMRTPNKQAVGHLAVYLGYDAIRKSRPYNNGQDKPDDWGYGFLIVVNRTAVRVVDKNYATDVQNAPGGSNPPPKSMNDLKYTLGYDGTSKAKHARSTEQTITKEP